MNNEKASGAEKLKRLGEFKNKLASDKAVLDKQLAGLKDEVGKAKGEADNLKGQLANAQKEHGRYMAAIGQLEKDKAGLSGDLKRAQQVIEAHRPANLEQPQHARLPYLPALPKQSGCAWTVPRQVQPCA